MDIMPTVFEETTPAPRQPPQHSPRHGGFRDRTHGWTSFALHPKDIRFETQEESEEIILFLRQHFITLLPSLLLCGLLLFVPPLLFPMIFRSLSQTIGLPVGYMVIGFSFWYVAAFGILLMNFIHWFFNIFIVTNRRIIDIDFVHLLYKEFSEAKIERIQDISFQTKGMVATMFDFGNVLIQTAGEHPNFIFESVPKPAKVVDVLSDLTRDTGRNPL